MDLARNWRLRHQRYNLEGAQCQECNAIIFPARPVCPHCRSRNLAAHSLSGRGELYSWTNILQPPQQFEEYRPYVVGLVKLAEGPLVTAQLTDVNPGELYEGMPLEMVTRKLAEQGEAGLIVYGYKFRQIVANPWSELNSVLSTPYQIRRSYGSLSAPVTSWDTPHTPGDVANLQAPAGFEHPRHLAQANSLIRYQVEHAVGDNYISPIVGDR